MPYKRGPNGTLRYYSSSTGRYTSSPDLEIIHNNKKKKKITNEEKRKLKKEILYNHVLKTKDKYVQDVFLFLEKNEPENVILVNERVYHKKLVELEKLIL